MSVCINRSLLWVNCCGSMNWLEEQLCPALHWFVVCVRASACVCSLAASGLYNRGPLIVIVVNRGCWSVAADWPFTLRLQPEVNLRGVCHQIRVKMMIQRSWPRFGKIMLRKKKQILCCLSGRFWSGVATRLCLSLHWIKMCLVKIFKLANQVVLWRQTNAQGDRRSTRSKLSRMLKRSTVGSNRLFQSGLCSTVCVYVSCTNAKSCWQSVYWPAEWKNNLIPPFTWLFIVFIPLLLALVHCMWKKQIWS